MREEPGPLSARSRGVPAREGWKKANLGQAAPAGRPGQPPARRPGQPAPCPGTGVSRRCPAASQGKWCRRLRLSARLPLATQNKVRSLRCFLRMWRKKKPFPAAAGQEAQPRSTPLSHFPLSSRPGPVPPHEAEPPHPQESE